MGILIKCAGSTFAPKYVIDTVEIPDIECEHEYDNACDAECNLCGATRAVTHNYVDGFCTICGKKDPNKVWTIAEYPVTDGLKGLYDFGSATENGSLYNHANPALVPTLTEITADGGKWTEEANYATFSGNTNKCRVDTGILPNFANTVTYVALCSVPAGGSTTLRPIIGNRRNTSAGNKGVDLANGIVEYCTGGVAQLSGTLAENQINTDNFIILAATVSTNGYALYRYTNNSLDELASKTVTIDFGTTTSDAVKIGGNSVGNGAADTHISLAAIHEGDITGGVEGVTVYDKLLEICAFVKTYGKQKGLTIE